MTVMEMTMNLTDYIIEDVEITLNGETLWANGKVEVAYVYEPAQRSVGFSGGVSIDGYGEMTVALSDEDWNSRGAFVCKPGDEVFDLIIKALGEERIGSAIADGHETF